MNVQQLTQKLQQFPQDAEVKICDGFQGYFYEGDEEYMPAELSQYFDKSELSLSYYLSNIYDTLQHF